MGKLYGFLGMIDRHRRQPAERRREEARLPLATSRYGQNNEFGFDYLRDNMKFSALDYAQRPLNYAIVDEVDSILIDEARTPLIISGQAEASSDKYRTINEIIPRLRKDEHYIVDEKAHSVTLTDDGVEAAQKLLGISNLYDPVNLETLHILNQCLRAHTLYKRDVNYMVTDDGKVLIIDEFTGRVLPGRRWSRRPAPGGRGQGERARSRKRAARWRRSRSRTSSASTRSSSGMTGTADTEAAEFHTTYKLDVIDHPDQQADHPRTTTRTSSTRPSARSSPRSSTRSSSTTSAGSPSSSARPASRRARAIARILKKKRIPHNVLNAKHHENEAYVVAQAGRKGAITVSTNMAGRGTDIILGGNPEMLAKLEFKEQNRDPRRRARGVREARREVRERVQEGGRRGPRGRRPAHRRHRAPRVAPHRQPAPRPRRPPGRPGLEHASTCRSKTT